MGFFDKFKKKEENVINNDAVKTEQTELYKAVQSVMRNQSPNMLMMLSQVLRKYIDEGTWIPMPTDHDEKGERLQYMEDRGVVYAKMYSAPFEAKQKGNIVITDINKFLEPVFANPQFGGIVIDPDTTQLFLDKGFFLKCVMHGYLPQQNNGGSPERDWGVGIPNYSEKDLMSEGEMLNFAMHTVLDNEDALSDAEPVSACDNTDADINLIYEKRGKFIFVAVCGYCAEKAPKLSAEKKQRILDYCEKYNATGYYAPVGFRSANDLERFNKCLALKGDGFYAKYEGLEMI